MIVLADVSDEVREASEALAVRLGMPPSVLHQSALASGRDAAAPAGDGGEPAEEVSAATAPLAMPFGRQPALQAGVTEREALLDRARRAERALDALAHELRTPLNVVLAATDLMAEGEHDPETLRHVQMVRAAGEALAAILSSLTDRREPMESARQPVSVREEVARAADLFRTAASAKGLVFEVEVAPDVPTFVRTDPVALLRVLSNLLSNAVRATGAGKVRLSAGMRAGMIGFEVSDTGCGMAPDRLDRLLSPSAAARPRGMGLHLCRQLAADLGGRLSAESVPGSGSTFRLDLPPG